MVVSVVQKRQLCVVISAVKKRQFWVVIRVGKERQFFLAWLKRGILGGY